MKNTAYLSLGSNVGDRVANLRQAIEGLQQAGAISAVSSLYETEPVEVQQEQPWFLNCVVTLETELSPRQLLAKALALEQSMGRQRAQAKAPRTIDIDIVLFGDEVVQEADVTIPHPAMQRRRFVLEPLAEIAPEARHPVLKQTARQMLQTLPPQSGLVRRYPAE